MAYGLGIDLGTSFTAAAICRDGMAQVVELGSHSAAVPTVLLLRPDEDDLVGEGAEWRSTAEPGRVARLFKRRMGDPVPMLIDGTPYSADRLMARFLRWVVATVSEREGEAPSRIAVTHPANWGPYKLEQFSSATEAADIADPKFLTEPEAAAIYYASRESVARGAVVAVYDLGGGTFDVALLRRGADGGFDVLGDPVGIERMGGVDFDQAVFGHVMDEIKTAVAELDEDDSVVMRALVQLRRDCVLAKELLSIDSSAAVPVMLPNLQTEVRITRAEFEEMIRPNLLETIEALRRALRRAALEPSDLEAVLLVGGSSRIPLAGELVSAELGRPVAIDTHPKFAVALGASIVAMDGAPPAPTQVPDLSVSDETAEIADDPPSLDLSCGECGFENREGVRFCEECGSAASHGAGID